MGADAISGGAITGTSITNSGLTAGRVVYSGTAGLQSDTADFTWNNTSKELGISSTADFQPALITTHIGNTAGSASYHALRRARAATTAVQSGDTVGTLLFSPYANGGYQTTAYISCDVTGAPSGSNVPTRLNFVTSNTGGAVVAATITPTGLNATVIGATTAAAITGTSLTGTSLVLNGKATTYNSIATAGWGVPAIYAVGRVTAQSAANASIATYTVGGADGSFEVSANMNVTASTTLSTTLTCTYTDESNTSRVMVFPVNPLSGTFATAGAISGAGATVWHTPVMHIRCKASTAITIKTTAGTFTGVTYTAEGIIKQMS